MSRRIPLGAAFLIIATSVNLSVVVSKLYHGGDPIGYANAVILSVGWAYVTVRDTQTEATA